MPRWIVIHSTIKMTSRVRFIATEGILRRGSLVGALITAFLLVGSARDGTLEAERWRTTVLALLSFLEWSVGAGWLIGSFMWSRRHHRDARHTPDVR
jgi:hypothetical protein